MALAVAITGKISQVWQKKTSSAHNHFPRRQLFYQNFFSIFIGFNKFVDQSTSNPWKKIPSELSKINCNYGTFIEKKIKKIEELKNIITEKFQTHRTYGINNDK